LIRYAETPLGRNPNQFDYADCRELDSVEVPFRVTTSQPGNTNTIQCEAVQQNVSIDAAVFASPESAADRLPAR
jgi:hypothetical protein